ncbi:MAG TPA: prolipoprotein diacylglyceryl transferase family protein, partial [Anaeromyxobacteraceae bacterium]|nr:prolipoprotein diacylglyceryl transferase family protein [Anaeromyxobacteraceae bacterium]
MIPYFELPSLHLGPFTLQAFGLFAALGVYVAAVVAVREARRRGLDPQPLSDFAVWGVSAGVLMGHVVHLVLYHPEELSDWRRVFAFWEGLSSFGGLLGGVLAAVVYFGRRPVRFDSYADAFALGIAPGWGIARVGCFVIHDHPGVRTSFFLGVNFPESARLGFSGVRHDLGLYDALALFAYAALLFALDRRGVMRGRLLGLLALLYGTSRFLFDFLRASAGDVPYADARYLGLTPAQYFCLGLWGYAAWKLGPWARPAAVAVPAEPPRPRAQAAGGRPKSRAEAP